MKMHNRIMQKETTNRYNLVHDNNKFAHTYDEPEFKQDFIISLFII